LIMALGLLAVLRDEEPQLPAFLELLDGLETHPDLGGLYCSFYENDSVDATAACLEAWLQDRPGSLITETFAELRFTGRETARTRRLAAARNQALEMLLRQPLDWLLVIDVDLRITLDDILQLFGLKKRYPHASMLCASSMQNVPDVFGEGPWSYYDSWALRDLEGGPGITFAANPFRRCHDRWRWMAGLPVSVASAFGGVALLAMDVVRQQKLFWNGEAGCEHWAFCAGARRAGPVLACPTVRPQVWHRYPPRWSASYADWASCQLT
jgi:hypothetical protein